MMKRIVGLVLALSVIGALGLVAAIPLAMSSSGRVLVQFNDLAPEQGAFVGSTMLRGIPSGGFPWVISEGTATVTFGGDLRVEVQGLVIDPSNATAQAKGLAGKNPAPFFFATLSCLDASGAVVNVNTATVPATSTGNASIEQGIALPSPCFAPLVFVRGSFTGASSGPWFAVSGF